MPLLVQEESKAGTRFLKPFFKITSGILLIIMINFLLIFLYDLLTQWDYFAAKQIIIKGIYRLSQEEVIQRTRVRPGINILSVNLSKAEKQLQAHPWVAEARISRKFPSEIHIHVTEHEPVAVVCFSRVSAQWSAVGGRWPVAGGRWSVVGGGCITDNRQAASGKRQPATGNRQQARDNRQPATDNRQPSYLINMNGEIFKQRNPEADPAELPIIYGLDISSISIRNRTLPMLRSSGWNAVIQILRLGQQVDAVLPSRIIKEIFVDRETGVTLIIAQQVISLFGLRMKQVILGYHNFPNKYDRLRSLLIYLKKKGCEEIHSVDLNNPNRIVVSGMPGKKGGQTCPSIKFK